MSLEQNDEKACFLRIDTASWKLKVDWKILEWAWSKMGVVTPILGLVTLKSACMSRMNWPVWVWPLWC